MSIKVEYRTLASLRAATDASFELAGLAAAYNRPSGDLGGFREVIAPGAFTRALASGNDCKCLFNHDPNHVLGRVANGTLRLSDSPEGLRFVCKLDPDQTAHRDLHASVKRGDIDACSFAFTLDGEGEKWDDAKDERGLRYSRRTLTSVKLFDVSVVTNPAYPGSTSAIARSTAVVAPRPNPNPFGVYRDGGAHRRNSISLEEKYRQQTGLDWQHLQNVAIQLRTEALELAADKRLRERVEAVGRKLRAEQTIAAIKEELGI